MKYFDYKAAAKKAGLSPTQLNRLRGGIRREFPRDNMQFELHVLRTCMAIRDGKVTIQDALRPVAPSGS